jgi:AcrR family transcriptional regulator
MKKSKTEGHVRKPTTIRRAQIVDAALRIIASHGSRKFTAQLLGKEVGVTAGAIFRHFQTMNDIVEAVIESIETIIFEDFPPKEADPVKRLGIFFQNRVRAIVNNPDVSRLLLSDHLAQAGSSDQAKRLNSFKERSYRFVLECLHQAQKSGLLNGNAAPEEGTILVLGSIFALAHSKTRTINPTETERLAVKVWSVIESALLGRDGKPALSAQAFRNAHPSIPGPRKRKSI